MSVRLVAMTIPLIDGISTPEQLITWCARVSNPSNQENFETAPKLLRYCINKKHWSIFEQVDVTFEINTTRDIGRQIIRHRANFQEYSQRYAEVDVDDFIYREARLQDVKNRQNSIVTDNEELKEGWLIWQKKVATVAANAYKWALENGIAKEQARAVLPEGLTPSRMYMKQSLRNWITYCDVRCGVETQKEHRVIAQEIKNILKDNFEFLKERWDESVSG